MLAMEEELDSDPKGRAAFPHLVGDLHGVEDERALQSCRGSQCVFPPGMGRSTTGDTGHQLERRQSPRRQHGDLGERRRGPDPPREQTCCGFPSPPADRPPSLPGPGGCVGTPVSMAMGGCPPPPPLPQPASSRNRRGGSGPAEPARGSGAGRGTAGGRGRTLPPLSPPAARPLPACRRCSPRSRVGPAEVSTDT